MIQTAKRWTRTEIKRAQELIEEGHATDFIAATLNAKFKNNRNAKSVRQKLWKIETEKTKLKFTARVGHIRDIQVGSHPEAQKCHEAIAYLHEQQSELKQLLSEEYHKLAQLQG